MAIPDPVLNRNLRSNHSPSIERWLGGGWIHEENPSEAIIEEILELWRIARNVSSGEHPSSMTKELTWICSIIMQYRRQKIEKCKYSIVV